MKNKNLSQKELIITKYKREIYLKKKKIYFDKKCIA